MVFQNQEPSSSLLLENPVSSDGGNSVVALNSFVQLQISTAGEELPKHEEICSVRTVIFVIDLQSDWIVAMSELIKLIEGVKVKNENTPDFAVFLHKSDGLSTKDKQDVYKDIRKQVFDELGPSNSIQVEFYLTSLYDHSILHAISKVVQRHLNSNEDLTRLLDKFCQENSLQKAYLFDILSKVYIASDSSSPDPDMYDLCNDSIDVVDDIAFIYNPHKSEPTIANIILDNNRKIIFVSISKGLALLCVCSANQKFDDNCMIYKKLETKITQLLFK